MRERNNATELNQTQDSYPLFQFEKNIRVLIAGEHYQNSQDLLTFVETPPQVDADYGIQLNRFAKHLGVSPTDLASRLAIEISSREDLCIESAFNQGPFLNFKLNMARFGKSVVSEILDQKDSYGKEYVSQQGRVIIDMSSPNIAKRMNYGHLRSTTIGDALANIYRLQGYEVIRDNHIGDWGTQFGRQIEAIKRWGSEEKLLTSKDPIGYLQRLYVKFHKVANKEAEEMVKDMRTKLENDGVDSIPSLKTAIEIVTQTMEQKIGSGTVNQEKVLEEALKIAAVPEIEEAGRKWFLKLEQGDPETRRLWKLCVDLSMKEFDKIYELLGVNFELTLGESFYETKMQQVLRVAKKTGVGEMSHGALIVNMKDVGLDSAIIQKSDGATVYMTRDLATAIYREKELKADEVIYVVGEDQKQYFQQLFEILRRLGYKIGDNCKHIYFGMVSLPEGKMSTRKGRTILLKDVINEGIRRVSNIIDEKSPELASNKANRKRIIKQIAIGALKWNDLGQDPKRKIEFHWEKALNLDGYSSPYIQYTAVRAGSIIQAAVKEGVDLTFKLGLSPEAYSHPSERALIRKLAEFPRIITTACQSNNPSQVAIYVYELAKRFNFFYKDLQVLKGNSDDIRDSRLRLVVATKQVITNGLGILGIEVPEKM